MGLAARRHAIPFFLWIGLLLLVQVFHLTDVVEVHEGGSIVPGLGLMTMPVAYAVRVGLGFLALLICRPWRYYGPLRRKDILPALGLGFAVFVLWIGLETECVRSFFPGLSELYEKWCVLPFGGMREAAEYMRLELIPGEEETVGELASLAGQLYPTDHPLPDGFCAAAASVGNFYAPEICGWPLALVRLAGSVFVISVAEEFFWRGFLMRWIQHIDFLDIDVGHFHALAFAVTAIAFGAEHTEWLVGILCGIAYGWFCLRTRDIWAACIAHATTNLLLGAYVFLTGAYQFW